MKRVCLALLALFVCAGACAEGAAPSLRAAGTFSNYAQFTTHGSMIVDADADYREGLFTVEGEQVVPCAYESLITGARGRYVVQAQDGLNTRGAIDEAGNELVPQQYGDILFLPERWVVGVTLEQTLGNDCDYEDYIDGKNYNAVAYDVYDLERGEKVGFFSRRGCRTVCAHGDYLYVLDRAGTVTVYDENLRKVRSGLESPYDAYETQEAGVVSLSTGEVILAGHRYAARAGDGLLAVVDESGKAGVCDVSGQMLVACDYDGLYAFDALGQARVEQDERMGLVNARGETLVPCEYDDIKRLFYDGDYVCAIDGYACVEQDGCLGYVGPGGEVTCPIYYSGATVIGLSMILPDIYGNLYIIAADGAISKTDYVEFDPYAGGDGRLLKARNAQGMWGVVDYHGNELTAFDQAYASSISIAPDGSAFLVERGEGKQAYVVKWGASAGGA